MSFIDWIFKCINKFIDLSKKIFYKGLIVTIVLMLLPLVLTILGGVLSWAANCESNGGNAPNCDLWGMSVGDVVYQLFFMHWLLLVSIPIGLLVLLVWSLIYVTLKK